PGRAAPPHLTSQLGHWFARVASPSPAY
ncbi:hypothetical protein Pmani_032073, partial [Petrolisthes manimaculis]